jgi:GNAT superfamily N-acetyltransferase
MLIDSIERFQNYSREHGLFRTFLWVNAKLLKRLSRLFYEAADYDLAVIDLSRFAVPELKDEGNFHGRTIDISDLSNIERQFGGDLAQRFTERLATSTGYLIVRNNTIAGYAWSNHAGLKGEGIKPFLIDFYPYEDTVYIYDCFTVPEHRNKGVLTALLRYVLAQLKEQGFKRAFLTFKESNKPMKSVTLKLGFQIEGRIRCRKYLFFITRDNKDFEKVCRVSYKSYRFFIN